MTPDELGSDAQKSDAQKSDAQKSDAQKSDAQKSDAQKSDAQEIAQEVLGYLNFSSGAPDPAFLRNINGLFAQVDAASGRTEPTWQAVGQFLAEHLRALRDREDAFRQADQAESVLKLVFDTALPAYRRHHQDLLHHQSDVELFQPFFIGRICEAVLQQGAPWDEAERIEAGVLAQVNDFLGYRPVPVLQTQQKIRPYAHESARPIPLYIRAAGVAFGKYGEVIERTFAILDATDTTLLFHAFFEPELLDELAVDPRAYDFDHPVNKRPNYLFGQWDMHSLDNSGRCRRFVVQQITLDALLERVEEHGDAKRRDIAREEILFEAAAVLAGTMLMGAGISGNRPDAHQSDVNLARLVQHIAAYRDEFYTHLLDRMTGTHGERLRLEAEKLRQPFGGARQDFNQHLTRCRAHQLQHVHLARVFSRMGHIEGARKQVQVVPATSARMQCDIYCRLSMAEREMTQGHLEQAAGMLPPIEDVLHRAIQCGALIDPWNILGFGGQFSLFPSVEDSIYDHRADELVELMSHLFGFHAQLQKEAAAAGNSELRDTLSGGLRQLAQWWDQFATTEVSSVGSLSGKEAHESADHVARTLQAWHEAGTEAGDVAFWRGQVEQFRSPKAYALVVEALLSQQDLVAAMALLIQWLSQADEIRLVEGGYSFHELAMRWMEELWGIGQKPSAAESVAGSRWPLAKKFLDFIEANAEEHWQIPSFTLAPEPSADSPTDEESEEGEEDHGLFSAAYEDVTYHDSTDDGFEGEMLEGSADLTDFELIEEGDRIVARLIFLSTLAKLWQVAAVASLPEAADSKDRKQREQVLAGWADQAAANYERLQELLEAVHRYRVVPAGRTREARVEYDRQRGIQESLLEQVISACVEAADAARMIRATVTSAQSADAPSDTPSSSDETDWEGPAVGILRGVLRGDAVEVRRLWPALIDAMVQQPLLYVALGKGGSPRRIVTSHSIQRVLRRLLAYAPRMGLLQETCTLVETIQDMEFDHPAGPGAVTDFHQMFRTGYCGMVECLIASSETWQLAPDEVDERLVEYLDQVTNVLGEIWLSHSQGVRLSVVEAIRDSRRWSVLKKFIERYGADLFTQDFMILGNISAILHQGVDAYLASLEEEPGAKDEYRIVAELDGPLSRDDAVHCLTIIMEAVAEHYLEYIDYNSTTTQSDRGEMLYTLMDFLRLRADYEREAWNLQPVMLAHEMLVRRGHHGASVIWGNAVARQTADDAARFRKRFTRMCRKYGMRLPSIADRLGERFIRPLAIDRLRAMVGPAVEQLREKSTEDAVARLEAEVEQFTDEVSGTGFDVPSWLVALEEEVDRNSYPVDDEQLPPDVPLQIPRATLSEDEVQEQLDDMGETE